MKILEMLGHSLLHALKDTWPILPFLYLTYLLMELLEHGAGEKVDAVIRRAGRVGPLFGGLLGMLPQCGFSATAASLYAGRVISLGTVMAVFLSTSDEMLPILISRRLPIGAVLLLLFSKALVAVLFGFLVDLLYRPRGHEHVEELCRAEGCRCEGKNVFLSALYHTGKVTLFIFLATFAFGFAIELVGEEQLSSLLLNRPIAGPFLSALIGLIPNCAASVILTEMHLCGALSLGSMFAGLLVGAGVGLLVLFRSNRHLRENLLILLVLYAIGVSVGLLLNISGLGALLSLA